MSSCLHTNLTGPLWHYVGHDVRAMKVKEGMQPTVAFMRPNQAQTHADMLMQAHYESSQITAHAAHE